MSGDIEIKGPLLGQMTIDAVTGLLITFTESGVMTGGRDSEAPVGANKEYRMTVTSTITMH